MRSVMFSLNGQIPNFLQNSEMVVTPYLDDDLSLPGSDRAQSLASRQSCYRSSYHGD